MSSVNTSRGIGSKVVSYIKSPTGPMTTHFWGPVANWGIVLAGLFDSDKSPELISYNMTATLCVYSLLFMRFAWVVKPRNLLLMSCHICNEFVQLNQLRRKMNYEDLPEDEKEKVRQHYAAIELEKARKEQEVKRARRLAKKNASISASPIFDGFSTSSITGSHSLDIDNNFSKISSLLSSSNNFNFEQPLDFTFDSFQQEIQFIDTSKKLVPEEF